MQREEDISYPLPQPKAIRNTFVRTWKGHREKWITESDNYCLEKKRLKSRHEATVCLLLCSYCRKQAAERDKGQIISFSIGLA